MPALKAVSLFTNCGAGDVGYRRAGFSFGVLAELLDHRLQVAMLNHPRSVGVHGDLRSTLPEVVHAWRKANGSSPPALLAACPPCQGISSARGGRGRSDDAKAGSRDPRNLLVQVVADAVDELRPRAVVVENVPAFLTRQVLHPSTHRPVSAAVLLLERLDASYLAYPMVTDLADHGVPQTRKRSFITLLRKDEPAVKALTRLGATPFPAATHAASHPSLRETLAFWRLPQLDAGDTSAARDPDRPLHVVPVWHATRYAMVAAIPTGGGRTAWSNSLCTNCGEVSQDDDAASCDVCGAVLQRPHVMENGVARLVNGFRRSSYARMHSDRPAATVTTASGRIGSDNTLHPTENRVMSVLECQLLQGIPIDFRWGDSLTVKGHTRVREMIGEAVPPQFTRQHGRVLAALLADRRPNGVMDINDVRVKKAERLLMRSSENAGSALSS
jgi:DNA (cytosine-5)-methyltransferase 1